MCLDSRIYTASTWIFQRTTTTKWEMNSAVGKQIDSFTMLQSFLMAHKRVKRGPTGCGPSIVSWPQATFHLEFNCVPVNELSTNCQQCRFHCIMCNCTRLKLNLHTIGERAQPYLVLIYVNSRLRPGKWVNLLLLKLNEIGEPSIWYYLCDS